ncbi:MrcB family domain-containing protein [Kitasatospora sp. NPDC057936]|uniref:MrcB family domain-containing protein n=1 Tax=Kitasatospora sp. NPDC057936 TaxID=3346283 RepID=UPI0036DDD938
MDVLMGEVLDLQRVWSAQNTTEMKRRGVVVRKELSAQLAAHVEAIAETLGTPVEDVGIEGRDGTGLKTEIPWTRVFSQDRSPSATTGWYIVYLFSSSGDRVYLSLNQGTTVWTGTDFAPRKPEELRARVVWARPLIAASASARNDLVQNIDLQARKSHLGAGYEAGNVVAIEYLRDRIPDQETLIADVLFMTSLLAEVYRGEATALHIPGEAAPEVLETVEVAARAAGRRTRPSKGARGQGFRLTVDERRAVELRAVRMATDYFEAQGWEVKDVGAKESFDLLLSRGEERLHAEVKGTTSEGGQVVLTRAEVERQRALAPHNALVVVHSIDLDRTSALAVATGGVLSCTSPWTIEENDLTVVSYLYTTGL